MFWFKRQKTRQQEDINTEREIQKIRTETLVHAKRAAENTDKLIQFYEDQGITGNIFFASPAGGKYLDKKGKKTK